MRLQPALEELAHGEKRGRFADDPALSPLLGKLLAPRLRLHGAAVEGERTLDAAPRDRVDARGDADLPHAGPTFPQRSAPPRAVRYAMPHAPCPMPHAPCAMRHAPCAMREK